VAYCQILIQGFWTGSCSLFILSQNLEVIAGWICRSKLDMISFCVILYYLHFERIETCNTKAVHNATGYGSIINSHIRKNGFKAVECFK